MILSKKKKYLQIALNSTIEDAKSIIYQLPQSERIIIEAGTPLIKRYGINILLKIQDWFFKKNNNSKIFSFPYIVADLKTMDRGETEVKMAKENGASAVIVLGQAPIETINSFITTCKELEIDSMIDMINVPYPNIILQKLKNKPDVVILHRGVDEEKFNKEKPIPYIQINKILSLYDVMIAVAGGDTIREAQRAIFNGANIVIVWKEFFQSTKETGLLAERFLKEIK